jgi:hypothetical protein
MEKLLDTVAETGKVAELPVMSTLELYALGALAHPLLDDHALSWWNSRPDPAAAEREGHDRLVRRNMIDPETGSVHPQVGVILAARSRPAFIIVLRGRPDGDALPGRFLGLADEEAGLRAVLGETAPPLIAEENKDVGPLYLYELSGPARASRYLSGFAADAKHVVIDLYLPGTGTTAPAQRFAVNRGFRGLRVEHHTLGTAPRQVTSSQEELVGMILDAMTGACK